MSVLVTWRDNKVNFYNKYLLLLEEYTDRQAECAVTGEVLWALNRAIFLRQGVPDECWRNSGCSRLAHLSSLHRWSGDCELAGLPSISSRVTASQRVFLALAARQLRAGRSSLHQLMVLLLRLAIAVCATDKLS
jgi:hypothetical protein